MVKQRVAQKTKNSPHARVTVVPALLYYTLLFIYEWNCLALKTQFTFCHTVFWTLPKPGSKTPVFKLCPLWVIRPWPIPFQFVILHVPSFCHWSPIYSSRCSLFFIPSEEPLYPNVMVLHLSTPTCSDSAFCRSWRNGEEHVHLCSAHCHLTGHCESTCCILFSASTSHWSHAPSCSHPASFYTSQTN